MPRASPPGAAPASSATLPRRGPCSTPSRTVRPSADACAAGACRASSSGLCTAGATGCSRWTRCGWRARCWPSWRGLPLRGSTSRAAAPRRAAPPGRSWRARRGRAWVRQGTAPASHRVLRPPGGTPRRATVIPVRAPQPTRRRLVAQAPAEAAMHKAGIIRPYKPHDKVIHYLQRQPRTSRQLAGLHTRTWPVFKPMVD
mmetsp:Transcript_45158/g.114311  ORF Transcript_45158/g.114311 Transcript_45158/m.114311 type:complete len:200 (+) Transcript_45158:838-1437(+)